MSRAQEDESADIQRFAERLEILRHLEAHLDGANWSLASEGSSLARDDELTRPFQTGHLVGFCLSQSLDMLRTIRNVVIDPADPSQLRMPMVGLYPLIRGALEASSMACWVLRPQDRETRLERSLRARWSDIVQDRQLVLTFTESAPADPPAQKKEHSKMRQKYAKTVSQKKRLLGSVAQAAGVDLVRIREPLSFEQIVGYAGSDGVGERRQAAVWRLLSGLSHPSASRAATFSRLEEQRDSGGDTIEALMTVRIDTALMGLEAAALAHVTALEYAAQRGDNPSLRFRLNAQETADLKRRYPADAD